jgi:hypothetical protein
VNRVYFCRLALQSGTDADLRGRAPLSRELELQECKAIYDDLKHDKRAVSDLETFSNPYTDSRILRCRSEQNVNTVISGIEIETPERLIADRLNKNGTVADEVCAHLRFMAGSRSLFLFSVACPG